MHDIWHYARTHAAKQLIDTLNVGLVSAIAIIEPRRRGKTTFLQADLTPAAQAAGFVVIYVNLAITTSDMEPLIATSISRAAEAGRSLAGRVKRLAETPIKKLAGKGSL